MIENAVVDIGQGVHVILLLLCDSRLVHLDVALIAFPHVVVDRHRGLYVCRAGLRIVYISLTCSGRGVTGAISECIHTRGGSAGTGTASPAVPPVTAVRRWILSPCRCAGSGQTQKCRQGDG